jgi:uncharacterized protein (TIGR02271 family)
MDIVRSEEELHLSSAWRPVERVRVRRRVVTEERVVTLTLRREELVVEREPVTGGVAVPGREPPPQVPIEIVLREEQAVITTRVVPVERVRVVVDRVTEQHELETTLRAEHVEVETEPPPPG